MAEALIPRVIEARDLAELLEERPGIRLLDVRTPGEYESVRIRGAYNVPLDRLNEHGPELRAQVRDPIVLICNSGQRAQRAEAALLDSGMPNLHVLKGGMTAWLGSGLSVERGRDRISLERQVRIAAGSLAALGGLLALLVNPLFALLPTFIGSGLVFAGITDTCGMAMLLSKLPYNRPATCDVEAMVQALKNGSAPVGVRRSSLREAPTATTCAS